MQPALIVVGGGIAGCIAAWQAAEAGHKVTLYEAIALGAQASGQALGVLVPSTSQRPMDTLQRAGCAAWESTLAPRLAELSGTPLPQLYRRWPSGGQLNLPRLFPALRAALQTLGVPVVAQQFLPETITPSSPILWAAGWSNHRVLSGMAVRAGVACRLAPCGLDELLVGMGPGVQGLYAVPDWDGTVLLGTQKIHGDELYTGSVPAASLQELRQRAGLLFAPLASAEVLHAWVGNRPVSLPRLPLLKPLSAPNQWAVVGLGGLGYALAPMVAAQWLAAISAPAP